MKKQKALSCIALSLTGLALAFGTLTFTKTYKPAAVTFATYSNGDAATYYNTIDSTQSGNTLLTALRTLNLSKRQSTVGYSSMGTSPSGQFKYTDYDTSTVQYDSNGQPYGTKISSFYTYTSATSWNREHVWPNSHGGGSGGDAGSPYPDADIHMPRPTISSENSSRGNSFFVEGMNNSSSGWDPYTAGYSENSRGEAARITFYCTLVNSKLILAPNNTTPSGTDSVTGQSFGSGHTMGNLETLIKWNINYPVTQREKNRNEGAEYLQGNRNAFVDHPEYACKIWGNVNNNIKNMCANASWDVGPSVSISKSAASIVVDDTTTIYATASDSSTITWTSSDTTVVTVSSASSSSGTSITLTGVGPGTAIVTARATINSTTYSATCNVTVSSSGGGGDTPLPTGDGLTIAVGDIPSTYSTTSFTSGDYSFGCSNIGNSYSSGNMQWKSGQGYIYNVTPISNISSITINSPSTGSFSGTIYVGSSSHPTSGTSYSISSGQTVNITGNPSYFTIQAGTVSGGAKSGSIVIGQSSSSTKTLSSIAVATAPTKTTYTAGEYFDPTGLVITRTYSDSTSDTYTYANHTSDFTFSPTTSTALTTSNASVTITYGGKSCSQAITVNAAKTLSSISVSTAPTKTTYTAGEYFDPTGLVITRTYSDSTTDTYTYAGHTSEFSFTPSLSTALTTSNMSVSISYGGKSCSQVITVNAAAKTLSSITISGYTTSFTLDDTFSFGGTVTANFSDSTSSNVTSSATFSGYNMSVAGNYTVTVSYTYSGTTRTAQYQISVVASGGGSGGTEEGSQRISASSSSTYYESGDICPTGTTSSASATCDAFDVSWLKNSGNDIMYTYDEMRIYSNNSFSITPKSGYTLTSVVITANSSSYASAVGGSSLTNCTKDTSGSTVTLTPTDGTSAVGFRNSAQSRINYIVVNYEYESSGTPEVTSISATVSKSYYVGETISKSDITVKDSNNKTISESNFAFVNDGYQFTYSDAASGGSATSKTFTDAITYSTFKCNLTVSVSRKAYVAPTGTTTLEHTGAEFKAAGIVSGTASSYAENQTAIVDGVTFNVSGYVYNNTYLSFSTSSSNAPGSVINTTPYPSGITNVTVNGASPDVQLSIDGNSWVDLEDATTSTTNYYYLKVYYGNTSPGGYVNISSIEVTTKATETAENIANYIMYEDTNNQCVSKLPTALSYYKNLNSSEKTEFQSSTDYVISTARTRLEAWASSQGKSIDYSNGELTNNSLALNLLGGDNNATTLIVIISLMSICSMAVLIYLKKKRMHQ